MKNSRLIVVLGMHRSGTSALTRGLQVMGVRLGDRMIPPIEGNNSKGFWEDIDLNNLNTAILRSIGSSWNHLEPITLNDVETLRNKGYFLRAFELLRQKVGDAPVFGVKDPRIPKLLPFWKGVFSHCQFDVSYILAVRHPLSVAKSLGKRDGFDSGKSYLLWLGHVLTSLTDIVGEKRVVVDYDRLMESPDREMIRIAKCVNLEIDPKALQFYKTEFLDQGLRHTVYDPDDLLLDNACPPIVHEVYTALLDVAADKANLDDVELQEKVARWSEEFERLKPLMGVIDRLNAQLAVVYNSPSWKITWPLRVMARQLQRAKRRIELVVCAITRAGGVKNMF